MASAAGGALLLGLLAVSAAAQQWQYVARLSTDVSKGETMIRVEVVEPLVAGRSLMIEDRDGRKREIYRVHAVYDKFNVILESKLKSDFAAGAKVFQ